MNYMCSIFSLKNNGRHCFNVEDYCYNVIIYVVSEGSGVGDMLLAVNPYCPVASFPPECILSLQSVS